MTNITHAQQDMHKKVKINLSLYGMCLRDTTVAALAEKKAKTPTILKILKTPYGYSEKKFVDVRVGSVRYFSDFITGTLYDQKTGACQSTSQMRLIVNPEEAATIDLSDGAGKRVESARITRSLTDSAPSAWTPARQSAIRRRSP